MFIDLQVALLSPEKLATGDQELIDLEYDIGLMLGYLKPDSLVGSG